MSTLPKRTVERTENAPDAPVKLLPKPTRAASITQANIADSVEQRICHWCSEPFTPRVEQQKFCTPSKERSKAFRRKQALVGALARQFRRIGVENADLLALAGRCIRAEYENVFRAMVALGWRYDVKANVWLLESDRKGAK